jgi:hypothetical protein
MNRTVVTDKTWTSMLSAPLRANEKQGCETILLGIFILIVPYDMSQKTSMMDLDVS